MITVKARIIVVVLLAITMLIIGNKIRKKKVELRYALIWFVVGVVLLILDIHPRLIGYISSLMGIEAPVNMLFFMGFCFSLCIIFGLTSAISQMSVKEKELAQELAILRKEMEKQLNSETPDTAQNATQDRTQNTTKK